jgi:hypothetical protein
MRRSSRAPIDGRPVPTGRRRIAALLLASLTVGASAAVAARGGDRTLLPTGGGVRLLSGDTAAGFERRGAEVRADAERGRPPCPGRRSCPTPPATPEPTVTPAPTQTTPPPPPTASPTPSEQSAIEILRPADGAALVEDRVRVEGTYAPAAASVLVVVNGLLAIARDGRFVANEVPLEQGESPIEATLHLGGVPQRTHAIRVSSEARPPALELRATPESGVTPLSVRLEWRVGTGAPIESVTLDGDGDGAVDHSTTEASGVVDHEYASAGIVDARATVRHTDGSVHEAVATIEVLDADVVDAAIRRSWDEMNAALAAGDLAAAETHMTDSARVRFGPVFERLAPDMATIVASYSELQLRSLTADVATYVVTRRIGDGTGIFFVTFEKGADGSWRLSSM